MTRYDTVRHHTTHTNINICRHTHTCKWKKNRLVRTGQNGTKCFSILVKTGQKGKTQILALRVYNMPTVSTISRPRLVYLWCTVSTDPKPPSPYVRAKDGSGPFWGEGGLRPPSQILALRVYNMPTVSTISRPRLPVVHTVYRPQTALPLCAGKRCIYIYIYMCVWRYMYIRCTASYDTVHVCVYIHINIYIYICIHIYTKASIRIMLKLRGSTFLHSYIAAITMSS